jgi:hypothetical protein
VGEGDEDDAGVVMKGIIIYIDSYFQGESELICNNVVVIGLD